MVAVSGFRVNEHLIRATRVVLTNQTQNYLRTNMELPFSQQTQRWLIQTQVKNGKASVIHNGRNHMMNVNGETGLKILKLEKSTSGDMQLKKVLNTADLPRGRLIEKHHQKPDNIRMQRPNNMQQKSFQGTRQRMGR